VRMLQNADGAWRHKEADPGREKDEAPAEGNCGMYPHRAKPETIGERQRDKVLYCRLVASYGSLSHSGTTRHETNGEQSV